MQTVTLDILDNKALNLLKDLEALNVIRLHDPLEEEREHPVDLALKYSGAMTKQTPEEIDKQLDDLRNEWD